MESTSHFKKQSQLKKHEHPYVEQTKFLNQNKPPQFTCIILIFLLELLGRLHW